jgi:glycerate kinase
MPLRVVCAPDSFKESMSAALAAECLATGVRRVVPDAECVRLPMADGGEGFTESVLAALGGQAVTVRCTNAAGRSQEATLGWLADSRTAVIEVAAGCGLADLPLTERNPLVTTSRGVGQLITAALDRGARRLVIGLGGSATNDAGAGMLSELGVGFLDSAGRELAPGGAALAGLADVDLSGLDPRLTACTVDLACDVDNPLLGPDGASAVFGPQKGARPHDVTRLDQALTRWAEIVEPLVGRSVRDVPGAGAAGGLGACFLAFTRSRLVPGAQLVADTIGLAEQIARADLVLTGEGRVDAQTRHGKTPWAVAKLARSLGKPVVMFGGQVRGPITELTGVATAVVPIVSGPCTLAEALERGPSNLTNAAEASVRLLMASLPG